MTVEVPLQCSYSLPAGLSSHRPTGAKLKQLPPGGTAVGGDGFRLRTDAGAGCHVMELECDDRL